MEHRAIVKDFFAGSFHATDGSRDYEDAAWTPHQSFKGVWLKHLVIGADTGGALSCHMVRVDPGCTLETHVHPGQWELHEVLDGRGECSLSGRELPYRPGTLAVVPAGTPHEVRAGSHGLVLFAKFFPALI